MAKTKQIGVRFEAELLDKLKEDGVATSPQKALNFLTQFYLENDPHKKKMVEAIKNSMLLDKKDADSINQHELVSVAKRGVESNEDKKTVHNDYMNKSGECETLEDCIKLNGEAWKSSLEEWQKKAIQREIEKRMLRLNSIKSK